MSAHAEKLHNYQREHDFFIGIDSDGCVFDSMELKHKECFIPNITRCYRLQAIARYVREVAEFINLYSSSRGVNRFPGLVQTMDLLRERPEVQERTSAVPELPATRAWLAETKRPGNPALEAAIASANGDARAELEQLLAWSHAVNQSVTDMVEGLPPFPHVHACLEKMISEADVLVVSATPCEALEREWAEHDIDSFPQLICGQEMGTKAEHLAVAAQRGYDQQKMLMIGDAPGDLKAARTVGALFFPINPGDEAASWQRLETEALARFFAGEYAGDYEAQRIAEFEALLPSTPSWKQGA